MRIFIGCSSSELVKKDYYVLASEVSTYLAQNGHKLIIGGTESGMMGKCYLTFKYEGSKVKAISHIKYLDDLKNMELDASAVVNTTFERTKGIYESSEVLLFLPGGIGSISEIFSFLEEKRTDESDKPIIIYNHDGYYNKIIDFINDMVYMSFADKSILNKFYVVKSIHELNTLMNNLEKRN